MKRRKKWETLPESDRQLVAAKTIAAVLDGAPTPAAHPLVGMYAHKTSTDPETTRFGWNHANQVRIHAVSDGVAWVQYFSYFDGDPTDIKPLPLSEMIAEKGGWVFYATWEEWRRKGDEAQQRYWDMWHREQDNLRLARELAVDRSWSTPKEVAPVVRRLSEQGEDKT